MVPRRSMASPGDLGGALFALTLLLVVLASDEAGLCLRADCA